MLSFGLWDWVWDEQAGPKLVVEIGCVSLWSLSSAQDLIRLDTNHPKYSLLNIIIGSWQYRLPAPGQEREPGPGRSCVRLRSFRRRARQGWSSSIRTFPCHRAANNKRYIVLRCPFRQANSMYPVPEHGKGRLHSSVWDVTTPPVATQRHNDSGNTNSQDPSSSSTAPAPAASSLPEGVEPGTVDIAVMIFVMSALHPLEWQRAIANAYKVGLNPVHAQDRSDYPIYRLMLIWRNNFMTSVDRC